MAPFADPARRPVAVIVIAGLLGLLAAIGLARSGSSASLQTMIGSDDPAAAALERVLTNFPTADELLLLVTLDDGSVGPVSAPPTPEQGVRTMLAFARELSDALERSPATSDLCNRIVFSADPELMRFVRDELVPAGLWYLDDEAFAAVKERLTPGAMREQILQNEAMIAAPGPAAGGLAKSLLADPLRLREFIIERLAAPRAGFQTWRGGPDFVSQDGRSLLIRISGARPPSDMDFTKALVAGVTGVVNEIRPAGLRVEYAGAYAIAAASERAIREDMVASVAWSVVLMQAVFLLGYRHPLAFGLAFLPVAYGIFLAFGVHSLLTPGITPLTAVIGAVLAGLGIDYSIHYLSHHEAERGVADGRDSSAAGAGVRLTVWRPMVIACATSVVGFLAVAGSGIKALRDFAILGALGLLTALLATRWLLPAVLALGAGRAGAGTRWWRARTGPRFTMTPLVRGVGERPRLSLGLAIIVAACATVALARAGGVGFETDLAVMHPRPNAPLDTQARIGDRFGAADSLVIYLRADSDDALVAAAHRVDEALRSSEVRDGGTGIVGTYGLATLLPAPPAEQLMRRAAISQIDGARVADDFREAIGRSLFDPEAYEPYARFLHALFTDPSAPTIATLRDCPVLAAGVLGKEDAIGSGRREAITLAIVGQAHQSREERDRTINAVRAALRDVPGATLTGLGVVGHDIERAIRRGLPRVLAIAGGIVVLLLLVSFRSAAKALLALLPVAFGKLCLLGYMAASGERLNMANMAAMPLLVGIGVDYGIFLVSLADESRARGEGRAALSRRLGTSFHAIAMTGATTVLGFATLAFTSVPAVRSLGRIIGVGVVACLVGALFALTPLLLKRAPRSTLPASSFPPP